jgi:hypothetical protein
MARDSQIAADRGGGDCVQLKPNLRTGVLYRTWSRPDRGLLAEITEPHRQKVKNGKENNKLELDCEATGICERHKETNTLNVKGNQKRLVAVYYDSIRKENKTVIGTKMS